MSDALRDIMIFAAGFGTRMAPLTDTRPKPLIEVAGTPLIDHAIEIARGRTNEIHVNAHYRAAQLADHLPSHVNLHVESPDILDTGGGLKAALPQMQGESLFTLNSDAVFAGPNPLDILANGWQNHMDALLLLVPVVQTVGYTRPGSFSVALSGALTVDENGLAYTGAQILKRKVVDRVQDKVFSLRAVWDRLLQDETAFGVTYPGRWADVGTPDGIPLAEGMLRDV
ncbi:MAG: nucleotidyltransferase family protein [Pseudomonadota bacterium]